MLWDELVKVALIGTDRSKLSEGSRKAFSGMGIDISKAPEHIVLESAVFLSLLKKSTTASKTWTKPLPEKAPKETGKQCSKKSRTHLRLILKGNYPDLLPEFVSHLVRNNKLLPLDLIPSLLNQAIANEELWETLHPAIGQRGKWLIRQNPEWEVLLFKPDERIWETGNRSQRLHLLKALREQQSGKAVELIQSTWKEDDLQSRVQFVKMLKFKASVADEAFLEECLDNRRKEIRKAAAKVLSTIPESRLCQRVFEQLKTLISLKQKSKKGKLNIKLPEELTDQMIRDGIDPSSRWFKGGVKASRLGQMIAVVPPSFWESYFKKTVSETLQLFVKSEWSELILQAITEATIRHKNSQWTEEILLFWLDNFQKNHWQYFNPLQLFDVVNEAVFNKVALINIQKKNSLLDEESPLTLLLRSVVLPWQDTLSKTFIQAMQAWIAGETSHYWSGWHLRPVLKKAALHTNPKLFQQLSQGWSSNSYAWNSWEKEVDAFFSILKFRKDMIEELEKKN